MSIQLVDYVLTIPTSWINPIIMIVFALTVLIVLKATIAKSRKPKKFDGYNGKHGFQPAKNEAVGSKSNGRQWQSGSYDPRQN